jgi:hypothetical protein
VQACEKVRLFRDGHAVRAEFFPHGGVVENGRADPGICVAGVSTACSAIKPGTVGIVHRLAAMTAEQNKRREVFPQAHVPQCTEGKLHPFRQRDAGALQIPINFGQRWTASLLPRGIVGHGQKGIAEKLRTEG